MIPAEEALAQHIGHFPSESLLQRAQTKDQQEYWGHLAAFYLTVSQCWQAKLRGNDPLIETVKNQTVNQWYYDAVWSQVDVLQSLWKLIESGHQGIFEAVINAGHRYPFIGAPHLFYHIVEVQLNNTFCICLKPYHTISKPAQIKALKIIRDTLATRTIRPQKYNQVKSLASQYFRNPWLLFSISILWELTAFDNQQLLDKLTDYCRAVDRNAEVKLIGLSRKRSSKNFSKFYSFTWHNGKIIPANKTGGTYSI